MKVLFLSRTPLAGMPWRTSEVCHSRLIKEGGYFHSVVGVDRYGQRVFPTDWPADLAAKHASEADLFILTAHYAAREHTSPGRILQDNPDTPRAMHFSIEPSHWANTEWSSDDCTVSAQYHWRFAQHLDPLPNCIPIDNPMFMPEKKPDDRVVIVYAPSTKKERGWGNKGYGKTTFILSQLCHKYGDDIEVVLLFNRPYDEVMRAKRHAHIVIDECVTGSYHSSALEGMSCGAVTYALVDARTCDALGKCIGDEAAMQNLPIQSESIVSLKESIEVLIECPSMLTGLGRMSREWMENHYSEEWQARKWIEWHRAFLDRCKKGALTK